MSEDGQGCRMSEDEFEAAADALLAAADPLDVHLGGFTSPTYDLLYELRDEARTTQQICDGWQDGAARDLLAAPIRGKTLRATMQSHEGHNQAEIQIRRGMRAWAVQRETGSPGYRQRKTTMVFGKTPSAAKRMARSPARLGEECDGDVTIVASITSGWDEPFEWPWVA